MKQLQIGVPNNSSPGNTFNNLNNGIYITNTNTTLSSTIELYNNSFSNIEDNTLSSLFPEADKINNCYQSPMGAAIFSHFGGSPLSNGGISLKVQNTISANTTTTFTNCDKGIVSNQTSLTAKHLGMNNVLMGIMCGFTDNRSYTIQNNQLDNVFIGVQLYGQNLNSTIKYNTINCNLHPNGIVTASGMGTPLFWPKGIEIWNFNSIADDGMQVNLNTINIPHYAGVGISLANTGDRTSAQTNVIQLSNTNVTPIVCAGSTQLIGIGTVNSNNTGINDNSINANTYSQTAPEIRDDISGILLHKSQNNYLKCNMVSGSRFGLVAINNCGTNPLAIQGNIVYNSVLGWLMRHLGDEGTLGDVGDNANDNNNQFTGVTPAAKVFKFCEQSDGKVIFTNAIQGNESKSYNINTGAE
ncbi:MAG: hypothetical protein HWD58_09655 [Bacteroidota bacterium]|nr:MAG: hypothetical protein HWD58_09655 [Bacteroidota bacterium]